MRLHLLIAATVMLVLGPNTPAWAREPKIIQNLETMAGEIVFLKLPGNPTIGFKWRLNKALSRGLHLVKVDQIGWLMAQKGRSMFFQEQSMLNVAVWAETAGKVDLAFDYYRRIGGRTYNKTSIVRVVIKPKLAAQ